MKARALLLPLPLAILTVLFQIGGIVAQNDEVASAQKHSVAPPARAARPFPRLTFQAFLASVPQPKEEDWSAVEQPGIKKKHQKIAKEVLSLIEPACRAKLKSFHVLYGNPEHRGLAGKGIVIVSGEVPDSEFRALLFHEAVGHFRDITCLTGAPRSGVSAFRDGAAPIYNDDPSIEFYAISWLSSTQLRPNAYDDDFVSGYAAEDPFEDLAETAVAYGLHRTELERLAAGNDALARKLAWCRKYLPLDARIAIGRYSSNEIAWDTTKLPYQWVGR